MGVMVFFWMGQPSCGSERVYEEEEVDFVMERERIVAVAKSIEEGGVLRVYSGRGGMMTSSLPTAGVVVSDWADEEAELRGDESDLIPEGLNPPRTATRDGDGHFVDHPGFGVTASSIGRLTPVSGRETAGIGEGILMRSKQKVKNGQRMRMRMWILCHQ